jgi:hypothetical protein
VDRTAGDEVLAGVDHGDAAATLRFVDGSSIGIPRAFSGRVTDLEPTEGIAGKLVYARDRAHAWQTADRAPGIDTCGIVEGAAVNDVFYRREPHRMRRYTALALDNIARAPAEFAAAALYRVVRLFVIRGSSDGRIAQQFTASRSIYRAGYVASLTIFVLFLSGAWIAWRRRMPALWLVLPIVYIPLTICFVLTNMRYTVTAQPFMFAFVAIALLHVLEGRHRRDVTLDTRTP